MAYTDRNTGTEIETDETEGLADDRAAGEESGSAEGEGDGQRRKRRRCIVIPAKTGQARVIERLHAQ